eukprot:GDKI01047127.1.p1 GENE.GDKI01047127.1~~GDKI01047127.1.p1  ORF type:complete len:169 (-),score=64.90 GDKI01047127.1:19-498(-)
MDRQLDSHCHVSIPNTPRLMLHAWRFAVNLTNGECVSVCAPDTVWQHIDKPALTADGVSVTDGGVTESVHAHTRVSESSATLTPISEERASQLWSNDNLLPHYGFFEHSDRPWEPTDTHTHAQQLAEHVRNWSRVGGGGEIDRDSRYSDANTQFDKWKH